MRPRSSRTVRWFTRVYLHAQTLVHMHLTNHSNFDQGKNPNNPNLSPPCQNNAGFRLTCRLPHCRYAAWSSLAVSELQLSAATPLWLYHRAASLPSCIEFNCLRSAAVGKAARLSIYWLDAAWRCLPLGHPSAASGACAVEQISSSKRQWGKRQVSLKPALRWRRFWDLRCISVVATLCTHHWRYPQGVSSRVIG